MVRKKMYDDLILYKSSINLCYQSSPIKLLGRHE